MKTYTKQKAPAHLQMLGVNPTNSVAKFDDHFVSYNPSVRDYGVDTTAIVFGQHELFFVLKGDHRPGLDDCDTVDQALDYYIANVDQAHEYSAHFQVIRGNHPILAFADVALRIFGQEGVDKIHATTGE